MIIFKNKTLGEVIETSQVEVEVGEILITKSERQNSQDPNFSVYYHRILGIYKPLGDFPVLSSAIKFGETFENKSILNEGYQIIRLGSLDDMIIYYNQYTEKVHEFAKNTGRTLVRPAMDLEHNHMTIEFYTKKPQVEQKVTAVDEADLVSFGNFLFKRYGVEKNLLDAQVSDADIKNWKFLKENPSDQN